MIPTIHPNRPSSFATILQSRDWTFGRLLKPSRAMFALPDQMSFELALLAMVFGKI
jgi:hypothetical protein